MIAALTRSVRDTIRSHAMVRPGERIAVAVSGGADSVALLLLLENLRHDLGVTLCVVHFNHQLRSHDSDEDQRFVASLARERGLEFFSDCADVAAAAKRHRWNLEDAARRLRYSFFANVIRDGAATRVATAHTADDQAETVLTRLVRGTGLTGLSAIHPVRGDIIRPLLAVRRTELRSYLSVIEQEWREDSTNTDTRRLRARVRQRLLPEMEKNFSNSIVNKLSELAHLANDDEKFWAAIIQERCAVIVARAGDATRVSSRNLLWPLGSGLGREPRAQNPFRALTRRIVRHLYADLAVSGGELSQRHVEQVIRLAEKGTSGRQIELPRQVRVHKEFDQLIFSVSARSKAAMENPPRRISYAHEIDIPVHGSADVSVPELGRRFHLKVIDWPPQERETSCEGVVLDAERLRPPLILRNWKPADVYCPLGRQRPRRVARMLMRCRVSAAQRSLWPVLTSAGRVAWADRMPVAKEFSTNEATRRGVWIVEDRR